MILKFFAKENLLVRVPGVQVLPKQPDMYVGRNFDAKTRGYPASPEGYEIDSDSDSGRRLARLARLDDSLLAGNAETAAYCGMKFESKEFREGVFVEKSNSDSKPTKTPAKEG